MSDSFITHESARRNNEAEIMRELAYSRAIDRLKAGKHDPARVLHDLRVAYRRADAHARGYTERQAA